MWRYGVFVAWATAAAAVRLQALVLLPAFLLAALVDAARCSRPCEAPAAALVRALAAAVSGAVAAVIVLTGGELSSRRLLGAYTPVGQAGAAAEDRFDEIAWHAFDVAVLGLGRHRAGCRGRSRCGCSPDAIATPRCARSSP